MLVIVEQTDIGTQHVVQRAEQPLQITVNALSWPPNRQVKVVQKVDSNNEEIPPPRYTVVDEHSRKRHRM
jgi:hypothetical protein